MGFSLDRLTSKKSRIYTGTYVVSGSRCPTCAHAHLNTNRVMVGQRKTAIFRTGALLIYQAAHLAVQLPLNKSYKVGQ